VRRVKELNPEAKDGPSHVWSGDAVSHLAGVSDADLDAIRAEYRAHLNAARAS
jgi:hypothetical protein